MKRKKSVLGMASMSIERESGVVVTVETTMVSMEVDIIIGKTNI